jgi:SAM-dependent methyltransferase
MLKDVEDNIPDNSVIVDMGCGKSYLTFAMYHYLNVIKNKNIEIMGFDLKADVVDYCNKLTADFGFDKLKFYAKDIADIDNIDGRISMIITLHACDTATDIALYHGIRWGCRVIMSVPCCQHELFKQIQNPDMDILLKHGILKERFSALMTDAIRAQILEIKGYKTSVMEFIDMEHTPKNIMIRAVKTKHEREGELSRLTKLMDEYSVKQKLYELCFERDNVE